MTDGSDTSRSKVDNNAVRPDFSVMELLKKEACNPVANTNVQAKNDATAASPKQGELILTGLGLAAGAVAGAQYGTISWALDQRVIDNFGKGNLSEGMKWWGEHSPMLGEIDRLRRDKLETRMDFVDKQIKTDDLFYDLNKDIKKVESMVAAKGENLSTPLEIELHERQKAFLDSNKWTNPNRPLMTIGTQDEIDAGKKLFLHNSDEAKTLTTISEKIKQTDLSNQSWLESEEKYTQSIRLLNRAETQAGSLLGRIAKGSGKGLLMAAGAIAAGYLLDRVIDKAFGSEVPELPISRRIDFEAMAAPQRAYSPDRLFQPSKDLKSIQLPSTKAITEWTDLLKK